MSAAPARGGDAVRLHHRIRASSGMFTAEFAVGLLAVVPLVLALVAIVAAGATQVRTAEAARTGARLLARGDAEADIRAQIRSMLPEARVDLVHEPDHVRVLVRQTVGGAGMVPEWTIESDARVPRES